MIGDFDLIQFGIDFLRSMEDAFFWLTSPISSLGSIDIGHDLISSLIESLLSSISSIVNSVLGNMSIIEFCFGLGFGIFLFFTVVKFFRSVIV